MLQESLQKARSVALLFLNVTDFLGR